ncbi:Hypothetical protein PHPALM_6448 [Phytophthora palmivora]|uniref:Reverse transcriptase RNase H-like domain-containing protein n=1 Tax=Phytophthora palmivora TaxID=4796 RepID=A0A2P4YES4_9STRA|nr:Hypothetical protein PHPALM_6448 [Phytophthora palmivora]
MACYESSLMHLTWKPSVTIAEQSHHLLRCISGISTGPQENWTIIKLEAFAIIAACDMLPHLLLRSSGFRLYYFHRNLIHVFAPDDTVKKHIRGKLIRWAMRHGEFRYQIHRIAGQAKI